MLVDSHTHNLSKYLSLRILSAKELEARIPQKSFFAAGIHPWIVTGFDDSLKANVRLFAQDPKCLGIGETGLDRFRPINWEDQKKSFLWHWDLAEEFQLPLILHIVRSSSDLLQILKHRRPLTPWQWHDFTGPVEVIKSALKFQPNLYFSFGPRGVMRNNFKQLWDAVPSGRRLLETDDSDMTIEEVYSVAQPPEDVLEANFKRLFALDV